MTPSHPTQMDQQSGHSDKWPTDEEAFDALRVIFAVRPWGRGKISAAAAAVLDGTDEHALDKTPALKAQVMGAAATIRAANERAAIAKAQA